MDYKEIITDIRRILRSINLESKRIQKDFGVSIPQLLCLIHLGKQKDFQATHKELREYLNLNSSTVTGIINRLEKKGLIARLPKTGDRRTTYVALTSAGYKLLKDTPNLLQDKLAGNLRRLSSEQIAHIQQALAMLIEVMEIRDVDASPLLTVEDPAHPDG